MERNRTKKRCKTWRMRLSEKSQPMLDSTYPTPTPTQSLFSPTHTHQPSPTLLSPPVSQKGDARPTLKWYCTPPQQLNAPQGTSLLPHSLPFPLFILFFFPPLILVISHVSLYRIPLTQNKTLSVRIPATFPSSPLHYYFWYNFFMFILLFPQHFYRLLDFFLFLNVILKKINFYYLCLLSLVVGAVICL